MTDETRDPELQKVRESWDAPPPKRDLHARILTAYECEFRRKRIPRSWRIALPAAVVIAAGILLMVGRGIRSDSNMRGYRPVQQPRFVVISQGEQP